MDREVGKFIWSIEKEREDIAKHGINFTLASRVFFDNKRKIFADENHSENEPRYFCIGKVYGRIITVRFTYREDMIRIFGAGYWRKGKEQYEKA